MCFSQLFCIKVCVNIFLTNINWQESFSKNHEQNIGVVMMWVRMQLMDTYNIPSLIGTLLFPH